MTLLTVLALCLLFAVVYLIIVAQRIEKAITSIAWAVDRPRREIQVLRGELKLIQERISDGTADADEFKRADSIHKKLLRWEWQEHLTEDC